eukprot:gnl/Trimastix_PCT/2477.p1 GENE.gnl/Trimastix_PCT/2477~~gnl/Trimastix_PCT/2477.p1  ORF type:complete len:281 (-),score=73.77 gnl/Trimastix_PCT/2477:44-886(-)
MMPPPKLSPLQRFTAGVVAGGVTKTLLAPLDNIKVAMQTADPSQGKRGLLPTASAIIEKRGPRGLWKGNSTQLVRTVPFQGIRLTAFPIILELLGDSTMKRFAAGASAGVLAVLGTYPLDPARTYVQTGRASGIVDALTQLRAKGALYKGLLPTIVGQIPYDGCSFMAFASLRKMVLRHTGRPFMTTSQTLFCGMAAGVFAQSITYPIDLAKRRSIITGDSFLATARKVYAKDGLAGFFRGNTTNLIKAVPQSAIQFALVERVNRFWHRYNAMRALKPKP